jgi:hypothetical protein
VRICNQSKPFKPPSVSSVVWGVFIKSYSTHPSYRCNAAFFQGEECGTQQPAYHSHAPSQFTGILHASHPFYISQPRKRPTFLCVLNKAKMSEGAARWNELDFIICVYDRPYHKDISARSDSLPLTEKLPCEDVHASCPIVPLLL